MMEKTKSMLESKEGRQGYGDPEVKKEEEHEVVVDLDKENNLNRILQL